MNEYKVEYMKLNKEQIKGNEPYDNITDSEFVEADSAEQAKELLLDWFAENLVSQGTHDGTAEDFKIDYEEGEIMFFDEDGELSFGFLIRSVTSK